MLNETHHFNLVRKTKYVDEATETKNFLSFNCLFVSNSKCRVLPPPQFSVYFILFVSNSYFHASRSRSCVEISDQNRFLRISKWLRVQRNKEKKKKKKTRRRWQKMCWKFTNRIECNRRKKELFRTSNVSFDLSPRHTDRCSVVFRHNCQRHQFELKELFERTEGIWKLIQFATSTKICKNSMLIQQFISFRFHFLSLKFAKYSIFW